jgi:hypothetical protein
MIEQQTNVEQSFYDKLITRKYLSNYTPSEQQIYLKINSKIVGVGQSFCVYSGLPKGGKSTYIGATIASFLANNEIFNINLSLPKERNKIALFDTESSEYDFYKNIERIKNFAGIDKLSEDCFNAFALREDNSYLIKKYIVAYLENNTNCSCIVIDGLLDLLVDYNDVKESRQLINFLKYITKKYNIFCMCVLHLGKKDLQTLGHLGSMVDRYANAVIKIEKNKELNSFEMTPTFMRSDVDFDKIAIKYFENVGYQLMNEQGNDTPKKHTYKSWSILEHKYRVNKVLITAGLNYTTMVNDLKELENIGMNAAKEIVKFWIENNLIYKRNNLYFS